MNIDEQIDTLVNRHGFLNVLAALCRVASKRGYHPLFRKLNRVYEDSLVKPLKKADT